MASKAVLRHLKEQWERACNAYLLELLNAWDMDAQYGYWSRDEVGSVYFYGDNCVIDMDDIRYCVDNGVSREEFMKYSDYNTDVCNLGLDCVNLSSWMHGCPRLSDEQIKNLYDLKKGVDDEIERLKEQLKNGNENPY